MELQLNWHKPLDLWDGSRENRIYDADIDLIPMTSGIYVFLRSHGALKQALYVGKAGNLFSRIAQQLNNVRLMKGIENAPAGRRKLVFATFIAKPGQQEARALAAMERGLIRYYLVRGDDILNKQGTKLRTDTLHSERKQLCRFIPRTLHIER